jgi:type IV secretion system protein TrbG
MAKHLSASLMLTASLAAMAGASIAADTNTERQMDTLAAGWRHGAGAAAEGPAGAIMMEYGETQPVLKCRPLNICVVRLQPGESLTEAPTVGDAVRWSVEVRAGGMDGQQVVYVVVKPASTAERTSMFLTTDRRSYDIELAPSPVSYTPMIAFHYPEDRAAANKAKVAAMLAQKADYQQRQQQHSIAVNGKYVPADKLDFNYTITGNAGFRPSRVFSDCVKTYVDLPDSYRGETPVFLVLGSGSGKSAQEIVNYRLIGTRFVIDKVFDAGELTIGVGGKAQTITIKRVG